MLLTILDDAIYSANCGLSEVAEVAQLSTHLPIQFLAGCFLYCAPVDDDNIISTTWEGVVRTRTATEHNVGGGADSYSKTAVVAA